MATELWNVDVGLWQMVDRRRRLLEALSGDQAPMFPLPPTQPDGGGATWPTAGPPRPVVAQGPAGSSSGSAGLVLLVGAIVFGAALLTFGASSLKNLGADARAGVLGLLALVAVGVGWVMAVRRRVATADALYTAALVATIGAGRLEVPNGTVAASHGWAAVFGILTIAGVVLGMATAFHSHDDANAPPVRWRAPWLTAVFTGPAALACWLPERSPWVATLVLLAAALLAGWCAHALAAPSPDAPDWRPASVKVIPPLLAMESGVMAFTTAIAAAVEAVDNRRTGAALVLLAAAGFLTLGAARARRLSPRHGIDAWYGGVLIVGGLTLLVTSRTPTAALVATATGLALVALGVAVGQSGLDEGWRSVIEATAIGGACAGAVGTVPGLLLTLEASLQPLVATRSGRIATKARPEWQYLVAAVLGVVASFAVAARRSGGNRRASMSAVPVVTVLMVVAAIAWRGVDPAAAVLVGAALAATAGVATAVPELRSGATGAFVAAIAWAGVSTLARPDPSAMWLASLSVISVGLAWLAAATPTSAPRTDLGFDPPAMAAALAGVALAWGAAVIRSFPSPALELDGEARPGGLAVAISLGFLGLILATVDLIGPPSEATAPARRRVMAPTALSIVVVGLLALAWIGVDHGRVPLPIEQWSVPAAAALMLAGAALALLGPPRSSWLTDAPGLIVLGIPTLVRSFHHGSLVRAAIVLAVSGVVATAASVTRRQAPAVIGVIAAVLTGLRLGQAALVVVPIWVPLGIVGVALLAVGARFEATATRARSVATRVAAWH